MAKIYQVIRFLTYFGSTVSDIQSKLGKIKKKSIKTRFMDYVYIDILSTSQRCPAVDVSLGDTKDHVGTS